MGTVPQKGGKSWMLGPASLLVSFQWLSNNITSHGSIKCLLLNESLMFSKAVLQLGIWFLSSDASWKCWSHYNDYMKNLVLGIANGKSENNNNSIK